MMTRKTLLVLAALLAVPAVMANTVAITEFLNNAEGEDSGREWFELYNYGTVAVTLDGWTVSDEDSDSVTLPTMTIPAGGYAVIANGASDFTATEAKAIFEAEWLGGVANDMVYGVEGLALGNSGDELILSNDLSEVVYNLAYDNDENDNATRLTGDGLPWDRTDWGQKDGPYIDRQGDDLGIAGLLGYERNNSPVGGPLDPEDDPFAWESDYTVLVPNFGEAFDNVDNGSWGSPLTGGYTPVPEPASLVLLVAAGALLRRR